MNETTNFQKTKSGSITSFAILEDGKLKEINVESSHGGAPCHIITDREGKNLFTANYAGGSVAVLPIGANGTLQSATSVHQHKGKSVNPQRQEAPHAHSINLDPQQHFAFVADLGLDRVMIYRWHPETHQLSPNNPDHLKLPAGSGPRHFSFHPSGKYAFVIGELSSKLFSLQYDAESGSLKILDSASTLPENFKGDTSTAEVLVHPNGKFVYVSNRGQDSIAVFSFDAKTGKVKRVGQAKDQIRVPRNFRIDPTGKWLLVASQDGNSIQSFAIDPESGLLKATGQIITVGNPVCIRFLQEK